VVQTHANEEEFLGKEQHEAKEIKAYTYMHPIKYLGREL
jgi:hypothetical protein